MTAGGIGSAQGSKPIPALNPYFEFDRRIWIYVMGFRLSRSNEESIKALTVVAPPNE